jgi:branched-chain amino acid transport system ATP-binding protein
MQHPRLMVEGLGKRFGGLAALTGVSLTLHEGETVSIIGPNGAGKTTLFQIVAGAERPDEGQIRLDGHRIDGLSPDQIASRGIARTFQNGRVFGNLSVLENILLGAHARLQAEMGAAGGGPRAIWGALRETALAIMQPRRLRHVEARLVEEAKEILALFGDRLLPRLHQPAYSLSYANRRRTELARALALRPRLLLLDEPTAGMNPTETAEMQDVIRQLRDRGQTILLIEHKIDLVMAVSDRVVALESGHVLVQGDPDVVRRDRRLVEAYVGRAATVS